MKQTPVTNEERRKLYERGMARFAQRYLPPGTNADDMIAVHDVLVPLQNKLPAPSMVIALLMEVVSFALTKNMPMEQLIQLFAVHCENIYKLKDRDARERRIVELVNEHLR
jgi:hypothetical protein